MSVSIEDVAVLLAGGVIMSMMDTAPNREAAIELDRSRKERYHRYGPTDMRLIQMKEVALLNRNIGLPPIIPNNPGSYHAELDQMVEASNGLSPVYNPTPELLNGLPQNNHKMYTEMFNRLGRLSGLTVPLTNEVDEGTWAI